MLFYLSTLFSTYKYTSSFPYFLLSFPLKSINLFIFAIHMRYGFLHILSVAVALVVAMASALSCADPWEYGGGYGYVTEVEGESENPGGRSPQELTRRVMLLYSAGYTVNISPFLSEDIEDLMSGWLPEGRSFAKDVVLVYTHLPARSGGLNAPSSPVLLRLYEGHGGKVVSDTLKVYAPGTVSASASQLNEVLSYIHEEYPAKGYGMIMSSHGSGYLPEGFIGKPEEYVYQPDLRMQKGFGSDYNGGSTMREIEIQDMAEAIPMHLDYLLFDACYMGGVEVAYELRDKCDLIGFSQAEVLAEGFCYPTLTEHLLLSEEPDPEAVCREYFEQYDILSGVNRSATVSMVDCARMEPLAEVCRRLFDTYRDEMNALKSWDVQGYYRNGAHWFYDLLDILIKSGISETEKAELQAALDECIVYKANTPGFMIGYNGFEINIFSGLSMYLPADGHPELDKFYRTLQWNEATGLVQ